MRIVARSQVPLTVARLKNRAVAARSTSPSNCYRDSVISQCKLSHLEGHFEDDLLLSQRQGTIAILLRAHAPVGRAARPATPKQHFWDGFAVGFCKHGREHHDPAIPNPPRYSAAQGRGRDAAAAGSRFTECVGGPQPRGARRLCTPWTSCSV